MQHDRHIPYGSIQAYTDAARSPFSLMSSACAEAYRHAPASSPVRTTRAWKTGIRFASVVLALSLAGIAISALPL